MRYFVTGATGFIGGRLARQLLAAGHTVIALVRDPDRSAVLASVGAKLVRGDVTDKESMRAPMTGADGVFHVAGWYEIGRKHREMCQRVNVDGTRNVLELTQELGIPKGVYTSTIGVFGDTRGKVVDESYRVDGKGLPTAYERTKWAAHYEVAEPMMTLGLPLAIVQPGAVYGPGDTSQLGDAFRRYLRRRLPGIPRTAAYCWGHVDDIARAHILAMDNGRTGESYVIGGEPRTLVEAFEIAERATGVRAPRHLSAGFLRALAAITRSEVLRAAPATYLANSAKAKRELGLAHRPLEEGLRETLLHEMKALEMSAGG